MSNGKNNSMNKNQDTRNLSDVFKELQEIRYSGTTQVNTSSKTNSESDILKQSNTQKQPKIQKRSKVQKQPSMQKQSNIQKQPSNQKQSNIQKQPSIQRQSSVQKQSNIQKQSKPKARVSFVESTDVSFDNKKGIKLSNLLIVLVVLVLVIIAVFPMNVFSVETGDTTDDSEEVVETASIPTNFEINRRALNMQKIISENSSFEKVKEQVSEEREIEYEIQTQQNPTLPRGEQVVLQEGVMGKENVSLVKTYENGEFIEEIILAKETIEEPTPQILDIGTSDFLADLNIHIGDTVYLNKDATLRKEASEDSEEVADIKNYIDVKLLELPNEDWCKVSFDTIEGYLPTDVLTSPTKTPSIIEKNRIQRILINVNVEMELNKSTGLTLKDYQKIFKDLPNDTNGIFEENAEVFYNMDKKYNVNGIFIASIAIHESAWGTSQIAQEKNNLFGYGSYDETPYESSYDFSSYAEGIETVTKSLVKYYLNPAGTKIYDGETASAWYYNGPTLEGVNQRYASDPDWHTKVYSYMEMLYNRLS